jgi:hypothetical protein
VFQRNVKHGICNAEYNGQVCVIPLRLVDHMQSIHISCSAPLSPANLVATSAQLKRPISRVNLRRYAGQLNSLVAKSSSSPEDSINVQFTNDTSSEESKLVKVKSTPRSFSAMVRSRKRKDVTPMVPKRQHVGRGDATDTSCDEYDTEAQDDEVLYSPRNATSTAHTHEQQVREPDEDEALATSANSDTTTTTTTSNGST